MKASLQSLAEGVELPGELADLVIAGLGHASREVLLAHSPNRLCQPDERGRQAVTEEKTDRCSNEERRASGQNERVPRSSDGIEGQIRSVTDLDVAQHIRA